MSNVGYLLLIIWVSEETVGLPVYFEVFGEVIESVFAVLLLDEFLVDDLKGDLEVVALEVGELGEVHFEQVALDNYTRTSW